MFWFLSLRLYHDCKFWHWNAASLPNRHLSSEKNTWGDFSILLLIWCGIRFQPYLQVSWFGFDKRSRSRHGVLLHVCTWKTKVRCAQQKKTLSTIHQRVWIISARVNHRLDGCRKNSLTCKYINALHKHFLFL